MASKTVSLSTTAYTKLDTGAATALDMQNVGNTPVKVIFAAALPAPSDKEFYIIKPHQGIRRDSKTSDMYALSKLPGGVVTVGE